MLSLFSTPRDARCTGTGAHLVHHDHHCILIADKGSPLWPLHRAIRCGTASARGKWHYGTTMRSKEGSVAVGACLCLLHSRREPWAVSGYEFPVDHAR